MKERLDRAGRKFDQEKIKWNGQDVSTFTIHILHIKSALYTVIKVDRFSEIYLRV
jgi:hypothetical protein